MPRSFPAITPQNCRAYTASRLDPSLWTGLVPAAGIGSRLGFGLPKILFPICGRPILEWLLDLLLPRCSRIVFVVSPQGRPVVEQALLRIAPGHRFQVVVQPAPIGMGDAVEIGLSAVTTPHLAVMWGDQAAVRPESVQTVMSLHQGPLEPDITCPTVVRAHPYIHFDRDADGRLRAVLQAREGDVMPETGESDTGFFCFRAGVLRELFRSCRDAAPLTGAITGELNLLPLIAYAAQSAGAVLTPGIMSAEETVGLNCQSDVLAIERSLSERTFHV